ncbi:NAD(P)-dependent oxidoreductase [Streptomyces sp. NEAU-W12]|uniref:NAD(P)-dependent oxidoreductase n=1 Tax=Streptomyces sp. NEAU-W12 TaxID=2994668 RepID=UPI00224B9746|nr:NAD(P)-dependent oxidoreductase [Streptomyces sp. NEAU-W12]MCX2925043.1 hypothetical protein [Streptomyces sp. NEAU-W12]
MARGPVVQEEALHEALRTGTIGGAALDLWWSGPPHAPSRLSFHDLPHVLVTPHHSGHTSDTFAVRAAEIADSISRLERGDPLVNTVRPDGSPAASAPGATPFDQPAPDSRK